jgi:hypothetical protein
LYDASMLSGLGRRPGKQGQFNHPTPLKTILRVTTRPSSVLAASSVAKDDSGRDTEQPAENSSGEDDNENDKQANNETNKPAHAYSGRDVRAERAVPGGSRTTLRAGPPRAGCGSMLVPRGFCSCFDGVRRDQPLL